MDRRDAGCIALLLALAAVVQSVVLARAAAPAPDAYQNVWLAQSIERRGLVRVVQDESEQILFPVWALAVHKALARAGFIASSDWAASVQIAGGLPLVACVASVYLLWRPLLGRSAAVAGCLFFCLLSRVASLGADGTSDSLHLFLAASALAAATHLVLAFEPTGAFYTRRASWPHIARLSVAAGLFAGLAILTRAEALVVAPGLLIGLAVSQRGGSRRSIFAAAAAATVSLATTAAVLAPYLVAARADTPQAAVARLLGRGGASEAFPLNATAIDGTQPGRAVEATWQLDDGRRMVFGRKDHAVSGRFVGAPAAIRAFLNELVHTAHFWIGILFLVGWWQRPRSRHATADWMLHATAILLAAGTIAHAASSGYLAARHLALFAVLLVGCAGYGAIWLGDALAARLARVPPRGGAFGWFSRPAATAWQWSVVVLAAIACAPTAAATTHESRSAHRQAARWLIEHASPTGVVLDSLGLTGLYTGRVTYRYDAAQAAYTHPRLEYVVVEQNELLADTPRAESLRAMLDVAAAPAAVFRPKAPHERHTVHAFYWRPLRFAQVKEQFHAR